MSGTIDRHYFSVDEYHFYGSCDTYHFQLLSVKCAKPVLLGKFLRSFYFSLRFPNAIFPTQGDVKKPRAKIII